MMVRSIESSSFSSSSEDSDFENQVQPYKSITSRQDRQNKMEAMNLVKKSNENQLWIKFDFDINQKKIETNEIPEP